jgi:hypothetical protein
MIDASTYGHTTTPPYSHPTNKGLVLGSGGVTAAEADLGSTHTWEWGAREARGDQEDMTLPFSIPTPRLQLPT